jgi:hypothetical protein
MPGSGRHFWMDGRYAYMIHAKLFRHHLFSFSALFILFFPSPEKKRRHRNERKGKKKTFF